jgi:hypothetical protein
MGLTAVHRASRRRLAMGSGAFAFLLAALLLIAPRAQAGELVYWENYQAEPASIAFANIDGSGGGVLNLTGIDLKDPEGMAIDSAAGRLYIASSSGAGDKGEIVYVNVDGSGAGVLSAPGMEVKGPYGVAIDPATRTIYWANYKGGADEKGSIAYAKLDGSGAGVLNTAGVTVDGPYRLAIDPLRGRVYWGNTGTTPEAVAYANLDNSGGGGILDLTGAATPESFNGISVDAAAGRVYWMESNKKRISYASVNGGGGGALDLTGTTFVNPYGLAIDPALGRIYWANYSLEEVRANAIGFTGLGGGGAGGITPATAPVSGPQDPVILKSPTGTGAPTIARSTSPRSRLSCSPGTWAADFAGSFVYQAPRSISYGWTLNGTAIAGATAASLEATAPGSYACTATAANQAGSASQASAATSVAAATVVLSVKKKVRARPGGVATFRISALNPGDLASGDARVCVKLSKKAKKALKAPKCKPLGKVGAGAGDSAKVKIKVRDTASGTYNVTFQIKGSAGTTAKAKIVVAAPKKK